MRQGLADFEKAASVDKTLADPHFGVGTILYNLGFFDIAQRGLYKIIEKGQFRQNPNTHQMEMRPPNLGLFPDKRNYTIFQAALDEFEKGQKLAQLHEQSEGKTVVFFEPQDVVSRIQSIRQFIGHQPQMNQDDELLKAFSSALSKVKPNEAFGGLFDVGANTEK
jgi:tRNA G10  N-methylase Trm11